MADGEAWSAASSMATCLPTATPVVVNVSSVATGTADGQRVEDYLVPAGATFTADVAGTAAVDESVVKPQARKPLAAAPVHKKHAAKAAQ